MDASLVRLLMRGDELQTLHLLLYSLYCKKLAVYNFS